MADMNLIKWLKKIKIVTALVIQLLVCQNLFGQPIGYPSDWEITDYIIPRVTGEITQSQIDSTIGRVITFSKEDVKILGTSCDKPTYTFEKVNISEYLRFYYSHNLYANDLDITEDSLEVMNIVCSPKEEYKSFNKRFILINKEKMIFIERVAYILKRIKIK